MILPTLNELATSREMVDVFQGYNHNLRIGEGEFYEMTNLTSDDYPILSPRPKRGVYESPANPLCMVSKDAFCYLDGTDDGTDFYINEKPISLINYIDPNEKPKYLVSMGAYVIIMPDGVYVNTQPKGDGTHEYGKINAEVVIKDENKKVDIRLCKSDGTDYDKYPNASITAPTDPQDLDLWMDTSQEIAMLKQYSATNSAWSVVANTYVKLSYTGIGTPFEVGDGVTISGLYDVLTLTLRDVIELNGHKVIVAKKDNYIVIKGIVREKTEVYPNHTYEGHEKLTFARQMPIMDFVIESENRLWGCRYGVARNGEVVNEIYASKLGDFRNWNCFEGISTDSYAVSVGTDGQFTGAITHLGYPLFFKENCIHKIYGNYPANFQIQTIPCRGVQKGCSKSLAIVNETLYYKSRNAICAYDGSLPVEISSALGDVNYSEAVAGALGNKYYISMLDEGGEYHLFVCDTSKGMWHREDNTQVLEFCNNRGNLYYIDYGSKQIRTVRGNDEIGPIEWEAISGIIGTDLPDKKYISRMSIRLSLDPGTKVSFFADYDSRGEWEHLYTKEGSVLQSFTIPLRTRRCDHLRLRIVGKGNAKIYSICKTIEQGSDV